MFLKKLSVNNWMIHKATTVALYPVTVFVGPNNGGKSALFDAVQNFSMVSRGRLSQAFGQGPWSFAARRHRGTTPSARIGYTVELSETSDSTEFLTYHITYSQQRGTPDTPKYSIYDEVLSDTTGTKLFDRGAEVFKVRGVSAFVNDDTSIFAAIRHAQIQGKYQEDNPLVSHCAREISRINKFRLDPRTLARPGSLPDTVPDDVQETRSPRLDYSGEGLATVLYFLAETSDPLLDMLAERVAAAIDGFEGFEFNTVGTDRIGFSARFADSRGVVPAANLSDGTLSLIGLMVLLMNPDRSPFLCLEEPENGLTPRATRAVYEAIVSASRAAPPATVSQLLVSSHSPFVICAAWNGEERDFIYQVKPEKGKALIRPFVQIVEEHQIPLGKVQGKREHLSLNVADQVMAGYYS